MKRQSITQIQAKCDEWNRYNPIGCQVRVRFDDGRLLLTTTRSEATVLGGHSAVIWLADVTGAYLLDRVNRHLTGAELDAAIATLMRARCSP